MTVHVHMSESVITMDSRRQIILEKNADPLRGHLTTQSSQEMFRKGLDAADTGKQIRHPNMDLSSRFHKYGNQSRGLFLQASKIVVFRSEGAGGT